MILLHRPLTASLALAAAGWWRRGGGGGGGEGGEVRQRVPRYRRPVRLSGELLRFGLLDRRVLSGESTVCT